MISRIYLEITKKCNLNCSFCESPKADQFMELATIKDHINKIKEVTDYLYLHILGEPLLHPDFEAILDYLDYKQMKLQLVTNGILLSKYPHILDHPCLRKLSISLHSIDNINVSEEYFKTIDLLIDKPKHSYLELRFYGEVRNKALSYLESLKTRYTVNSTTKQNSYKIKDKVYIYLQPLFHWPDINNPYIGNVGYCKGAINMLGILVNSEVVICCLDPKGYTAIANLKDCKLTDIINSEKYLKIVENIKRAKLDLALCQRCTYRLRFK